MKKTLIALAAVAASTGAMAQATISGTFDISAIANSKVTDQTGAAAGTDTKTNGTAVQNTWTTSQIVFAATEDLGGGLRATATMSTGIAGTSSFADRDTHLTLAGKFGTVRMGRFVPAAVVGFHSLSGAASTAVGSLYGMSTAAATAPATDRFGDRATGSLERNNNNLQYTSPSFNGLTLNVNYGKSSTDRSAAANTGKGDAEQHGLSVTYAAGPLTVAAGFNEREVQREAAALIAASGVTGVGQIDAVTQRTRKADLNWIGASYDLGVARVMAAQVSRKDTNTSNLGVTTTLADIKVNSIGVSVPMGAFTFAASTYSGKDKVGAAATDNTKLSGQQLSVRYALSKRTTVYALMGENKIKRDGGNTTGAARKETGNMIGLLHTF